MDIFVNMALYSNFLFLVVVSDILFPDLVVVTWQLVALIIILIAIPYVPLIKKVRYGDWEAELESLLVRAERTIDEPDLDEPSASRDGSQEPDSQKDREERGENEETKEASDPVGERVSELRKMANAENRFSEFRRQTDYYIHQDPIVALSNLRMELDRTLEVLARQHDLEYREDLGISLHDLVDQDILPEDDVDDLDQIYSIANKAIHGDEVNRNTARRILELGERVLKKLYLQIEGDISTDPSEPPVDLETETE